MDKIFCGENSSRDLHEYVCHKTMIDKINELVDAVNVLKKPSGYHPCVHSRVCRNCVPIDNIGEIICVNTICNDYKPE